MQAANHTVNDELIGRTREVWQPRLGRDLSLDEAKQIVGSATGFFATLAEWSRTGAPAGAISDAEGVRQADLRLDRAQ